VGGIQHILFGRVMPNGAWKDKLPMKKSIREGRQGIQRGVGRVVRTIWKILNSKKRKRNKGGQGKVKWSGGCEWLGKKDRGPSSRPKGISLKRGGKV